MENIIKKNDPICLVIDEMYLKTLNNSYFIHKGGFDLGATHKGIHLFEIANNILIVPNNVNSKNFCLNCFLYFLIKNEDEKFEIENIVSKIKIKNYIKHFDHFSFSDNYIYFYNIQKKSIKKIVKTYSRHPYCKKHSEPFFNVDFYDNILDVHFKNLDKHRDISNVIDKDFCNKILNDCDIFSYTGINQSIYSLRYGFGTKTVNPLFFQGSNTLYLDCYGNFFSDVDKSKFLAIMEGIERFCTLSFGYKKHITKKSKAIHEIYTINIKKNTINNIKIDKFGLGNSKRFSTVGGAVHTNYKQAILNGLSEIIETNSLINLWIKRMKCLHYNLSEIKLSFPKIIQAEYRIFILDVPSVIGYTTLICGFNEKNKNIPYFISGSGHGFNKLDSIQSAHKEFIQKCNNIDSYINYNSRYNKKLRNKFTYYYEHNNFHHKLLEFLRISIGKESFNKNITKSNYDNIISKFPYNIYLVDTTPKFIQQKGLFSVKIYVKELKSDIDNKYLNHYPFF
ncbi:YcaO-like family protein [Candidatus Gracilibacteria bacterium]|nr:YcaO-like family protein [Candidatus Gracilibacteria bacterium]